MKWSKFLIFSGVAAFILVELLFPSITGPQKLPLELQAKNTAFNLNKAITAYHTEYRDYPILDPVNDVVIDSEHALMDILLGSDKQRGQDGRNPRGIAFYTDKAAKPMGGGRFRKGLTYNEKDGSGQLWDPWGNFYRVRFDTDRNGKVENPEKPGTFIPESILTWSAGPDGDFETWEDNVKTW